MQNKFKLKFIVSRWANFYFFVDNFAEHVAFARKRYNQAFLQQLGPLTRTEKQALVQYHKLIEPLKTRKIYSSFNAAFFKNEADQNKLWQSLRTTLTPREEKTLKMIFKAWQKRFNKAWRKYSKILQNNKLVLNRYCQANNLLFFKSLKRLSLFYKTRSFPNRTEIYLIMMPLATYAQGGRRISKSKIFLETSSLEERSPRLENVALLILHELTHAFFESDEYKQGIIEFFSKQKPLSNLPYNKSYQPELLREVIIASLTWNSFKPKGITLDKNNKIARFLKSALKISPQTKTPKTDNKILFDLNIIKLYVAWKTETLVHNYIIVKKPVDLELLRQIYGILQNYPNNLIKDLKERGY